MIDISDAFMLAIDTGVLTLIWLVQLVIYPGLARYSNADLKKWHPIYTKNVTWVVLPLMFGQLFLSVYWAWMIPEFIQITHLGLVIIAWLITFLRAVPLHQTLENENAGMVNVLKLIQVNWYRTLVWSMAWGLSILEIIVNW